MTATIRFVSIFTLLLVAAVCAFAESKPKLEEVAGKLSCYCGTCPHLVVTQCGCSTADQIKADIQKMIDSGMSEAQIIQSYVNQYGETVLSAPPKKGFHLTAWILPFLAFLVGGSVLFVYLKQQQRDVRPVEKTGDLPGAAEIQKDTYYQRLQQELDQRK
jgi:cytochrome c-type biogenesis protein CcmH